MEPVKGQYSNLQNGIFLCAEARLDNPDLLGRGKGEGGGLDDHGLFEGIGACPG